jgi:AcrR family transcriptional regulator
MGIRCTNGLFLYNTDGSVFVEPRWRAKPDGATAIQDTTFPALSKGDMQKPNEAKRRKIIQIAARLFSVRPFHEVRLDDIAAAAHVGKGTVYIYFKSKEELYASLIQERFSRLLEELRGQLARETSPVLALERIVRGLVGFAFDHPDFYELLRAVAREEQRLGLLKMRQELTDLILMVLRRGARQGIWIDAHPQLTAVFIPGLVRSARLFGPTGIGERALAEQILRLLREGLRQKESE